VVTSLLHVESFEQFTVQYKLLTAEHAVVIFTDTSSHVTSLNVATDLKRISEWQQLQHGTSVDLEPHLKKLNNARRRIVLVNNVLQNAQVG